MTEEELRAIVELESHVISINSFRKGDWVATAHHKEGVGSGKLIVAAAKSKEGCINKLYKRWVEVK